MFSLTYTVKTIVRKEKSDTDHHRLGQCFHCTGAGRPETANKYHTTDHYRLRRVGLKGVTSFYELKAQARRNLVQRLLCFRCSIQARFASSPALLGCFPVSLALHVRTAARTRAKATHKVDVVPQTSSLAVAPVAVATVVHITDRSAGHERAVLQQPCLRVLDEPNPRVKVVDDLLAP